MEFRYDNLSGLLQSSLRKVMTELIQTEYPEYKWQQLLIPVDPAQYPGAAVVTYQRITHTGVWQPIASQTTSIAESDFGVEPVSYGTDYFGTSITYTIQDLDRLQFANSNIVGGMALDLTREKYNAAMQGYYQLVERSFVQGIPGKNIFGVLTHPDISRLFTATPIAFTNTGDVNLAIINSAVSSQVVDTLEVERPDTVVFPTSIFELLSLQRIGGDGAKTVLRHFLDNSPHIRNVESSPQLENAGTFGGRALFTYRRDPSKLVGAIPKRFTAYPPQARDYGYKVLFDCMISGVHIKKPRSVTLTEGV